MKRGGLSRPAHPTEPPSAAASQHQTPALSAAQPIAIVASLASQPTAAWPLPAAAGQREVQRGGLSRPAHPTEPPSAAASQHQTPALSAAQPIAIVASLASQPTAAWPLPAAAGQRSAARRLEPPRSG